MQRDPEAGIERPLHHPLAMDLENPEAEAATRVETPRLHLFGISVNTYAQLRFESSR